MPEGHGTESSTPPRGTRYNYLAVFQHDTGPRLTLSGRGEHREPRSVGAEGWAATHCSMICCALSSTDGWTERPSAFAVRMLTTSSNLVGCSTGRSAGFAPRRILSVRRAARRQRSGRFGPYDMTPPSATRFDRPKTAGIFAFNAESTIR